ncbi:MFS transporter [Fodinicola feengrottensis]|uniref:MFS transporter n=1 Tax=Fodinicola feengrottensis TaxID=435914 RepID=UPI0024432F1B|nr:MFS transporter [Fodinicola feengrottensis]
MAARLDRLPILRTHRVLTAVIGIGLFFDAYENFLAGTIAKVLQKDFALGGTELKLVLASAFIGQFLGAIVLGRLADRIGRRRAFLINLAIYSGFSLLGALSPNATWLIVSRFCAGLGIGAEYALADSYLSDMLPPGKRGRFISWAYTVSFCCGVPAVGFLALCGWCHRRHWASPAGAGCSCWARSAPRSCVFLRRRLTESPRWLEIAGRQAQAEEIVTRMEAEAADPLPEPDPDLRPAEPQAVPISRLFSPRYLRRTVMLWVGAPLSALEVFGYYGFGTLAPLILAARGYGIIASIGYTALSYLGYPLGSLLSVPIVERVERKYLVMGSAALMAVFGLGFGLSGQPAVIVAFGFLYTLASNVFSNAYHVYLSELYPTAMRGTAAGTAYSLSKIVTGALPFILLPVLTSGGAGWVFTVVAVAMVLLIINVGVLGTRTTGRSVDSVT